MSNETKIGLMATVIIAAFIWGFKFIQGKNLFSNNNLFYVEYSDVAELTSSSPVFKNGLQIGTVSDIQFKSEDMDRVIVTIDVDGDLPVPKDAVAELMYQGVMGGRAINLAFSTPCSGANCADSGDFIKSKGKGLLSSLVDPSDIPAYMDQLTSGAKDMINSMNAAMSDPAAANTPMGKMINNMSVTLSNLSKTTEELNKLLAGSSGPLKRTLQNVEGLTANLNQNSDKITAILDNSVAMTAKFKEVDLNGTINKTKGTMDSATKTLDDLRVTLEKANNTFTGVTKLLDGIQRGEGSLGKLAKDEELYKKLNTAAKEVELLLQDVRLHPKRYTRILGKKETPYEVGEDPARQN